MLKMIFLNFIIMISLILTIIKTPLSIGLSILMQTLIYSFLLNVNSNIYWMSYILYLIMLGGILILFLYMCSIASNEIMKFNTNWIFFFSSFFFLNLLIFNKMFWLNFLNSKINLNFFINKETIINISKIYNNLTTNITIMLIIFLLISLMMVSMFVNTNFGPLRSTT